MESREVLMPTRRREIDVTVTGPGTRPQGRSSSRTATRSRPSTPERASAPAAGRAAARRRRSLAVLVGLLLVVGVASLLGFLPAWSLAVPALLIVVFVVVARRQVTAAQARRHRPVRRSARRYEDDEDVREPLARPGGRAVEHSPAPAGAVDVVSASDGTWMPVDAPLPTYVTAPRASRIPRVIDLTTPGTWTGAAMVAEARRARSTTIDGASFADMYVDDDIAVDASLHAPAPAEFFDQMIDDEDQAPPLRRAVNE